MTRFVSYRGRFIAIHWPWVTILCIQDCEWWFFAYNALHGIILFFSFLVVLDYMDMVRHNECFRQVVATTVAAIVAAPSTMWPISISHTLVCVRCHLWHPGYSRCRLEKSNVLPKECDALVKDSPAESREWESLSNDSHFRLQPQHTKFLRMWWHGSRRQCVTTLATDEHESGNDAVDVSKLRIVEPTY